MATNKPVKRIKLDSKKSPKEKGEKKSTTKVVKSTKEITPGKTTKRSVSAKTVATTAAKPATGLWGYVRGSWNELRQVRWPNRSATWGLTLAVICFTLFFTVVILILDAGFQYLFKEVLLK